MEQKKSQKIIYNSKETLSLLVPNIWEVIKLSIERETLPTVLKITMKILTTDNYLIYSKMCYKLCFNGYTSVTRSRKLYNRNIMRSQYFLLRLCFHQVE